MPSAPGGAGTLGKAGVHPAPQPDLCPPGPAAAPPAPPQPAHIPGKVSTKLQWTAIKHKGHRSWAFEADTQAGRAGRATGRSRCPLMR